MSEERLQDERQAFEMGQARRDRLRWAVAMHEKGYVSEEKVRAERKAFLGRKAEPDLR